MPFFFRQLDLRLCEHDALQQRDYRNAEMPRKILCLIEAALILPARMQRHGHDDIRVPQDPRARHLHQIAKRPRDRSAPLVLQRMDDFLHAPFVAIDGARPIDAVIGVQLIEQARREAKTRPAVVAHRAA